MGFYNVLEMSFDSVSYSFSNNFKSDITKRNKKKIRGSFRLLTLKDQTYESFIKVRDITIIIKDIQRKISDIYTYNIPIMLIENSREIDPSVGI